MAVSFSKDGKPVYLNIHPNDPKRSEEEKLTQFSVFGRLDLSVKTMSQFIGMSLPLTYTLLRRSDYAQAYNRGRAEAVVAVRQKQLAMALDPNGSERMVIHAGIHFGEQEVIVDPESMVSAMANANARSWGNELASRAEAVRKKLLEDGA